MNENLVFFWPEKSLALPTPLSVYSTHTHVCAWVLVCVWVRECMRVCRCVGAWVCECVWVCEHTHTYTLVFSNYSSITVERTVLQSNFKQDSSHWSGLCSSAAIKDSLSLSHPHTLTHTHLRSRTHCLLLSLSSFFLLFLLPFLSQI